MKTVKIKESDLINIIEKVIEEQQSKTTDVLLEKAIRQLVENKALLKEEVFTDLFSFLNNDPGKQTVGSVHYVARLACNKFLYKYDDEGNPVYNKGGRPMTDREKPNPIYCSAKKKSNIVKHTRFYFRWQDVGKAYEDAARAIDPNYEFSDKVAKYDKMGGYSDTLKFKVDQDTFNSMGYFPIIPTGQDAVYTIINADGSQTPIDLADYSEELKKIKAIDPDTGLPAVSGAKAPKIGYKNLMLDKIHSIHAGGNIWDNPNFSGEYFGKIAKK